MLYKTRKNINRRLIKNNGGGSRKSSNQKTHAALKILVCGGLLTAAAAAALSTKKGIEFFNNLFKPTNKRRSRSSSRSSTGNRSHSSTDKSESICVVYPEYMKECFKKKNIELVPVVVQLNTEEEQKRLSKYARYSYPLCDITVRNFIESSQIVCTTSSNQTIADKIHRMLECRPLSFYNHHDKTLYKDLTETNNTDDYVKYSKSHSEKYMNYDEIAVSALLGVSCYTPIYNHGNRNNKGKIEYGSNPPWIVLVGLVGPRFEKMNENFMESAHMMVSSSHTPNNGYGNKKHSEYIENPSLEFWKTLYQVEYFPSYEEAQKDTSGLYLEHYENYLNIAVYKKRLCIVFRPFIQDAVSRFDQFQKPIHLVVTGLGLGCWGIKGKDESRQRDIYVDTFVECLKQNPMVLGKIHNVTFSWVHCTKETKETQITKDLLSYNITCVFSEDAMGTIAKNNPNQLVVAMYAWDGNAYPGNEFYCGMWTASGDPAAACCTAISILQAPEGNPNYIKGEACKFYPTEWPRNSIKRVSKTKKNAILLMTGAMNPIHRGHIQMLHSAEERLRAANYNVIKAYISPSHDLYVKPKAKDLNTLWLSSNFRLELARRAVSKDTLVSVAAWEAYQNSFKDFWDVCEELKHEFDHVAQVFYVCGTDHADRCKLWNGMNRNGMNKNNIGVVIVPRKDYKESHTETELVFIASPTKGEIASFSSTKVRAAIEYMDEQRLNKYMGQDAKKLLLQPTSVEKVQFQDDYLRIQQHRSMRLMTYNIFATRCRRNSQHNIANFIKNYEPPIHILCTQEDNNLEYLNNTFETKNPACGYNSGEAVQTYVDTQTAALIKTQPKCISHQEQGFPKRYARITTISDVKIVSLHLEGGRFSDLQLFDNYKLLIHQKCSLLEEVIDEKVDIICGDFNSVYAEDQNRLEEFLNGQYEYFETRKPPGINLTDNEIQRRINELNSKPYTMLKDAGFVYAKPLNEKKLVTNGRGNSIIDCVWYNPQTIIKKSCRIIDKQGGEDWESIDTCDFSDHNPVLFEFKAKMKQTS